MCVPVLAAAAIGTMGLQAAGGIYSASQENAAGKSQQSYYDSLAATSKIQSDIALKQGDTESKIAQDEGSFQSKQAARNAAALGAAQRVTMAAMGTGSGRTAANIIGDTADKASLDQVAISYGANSRSYAAKTNAANQSWADLTEANQYTAAGINARKAAAAKANSTLFSTAGQVAGTGMNMAMYS